MKIEKTYHLSDGQIITASELSKALGITKRAARNRLNKENDALQVYKTTSELHAEKAKIWTLSNGIKGTVQSLALMSGLKEDTLRQRLANSTNVNKVFAKQTLKTKLFLLGDGTKVTVQEYATRMKLSAECAQNELINIALDSECPRKQFKLSNGTTVTLDEVMKIAGITNTAAKYRLNISNDPKKVLKKSIRLKRQSLVPNCHHMFQCDRTGSIMKIGI